MSDAKRFYGGLDNGKPAEGLDPAKFVPAKGTVLVKPDSKEEVTRGGILLPDTAQEERTTGRVVAISGDSGQWTVGDRVLMHVGSATRVTFGTHGDFLIAQYHGQIDDDILGKFVD